MKYLLSACFPICCLLFFACSKDNNTANGVPTTLKVGDKYQGGTIVYILYPVNPGYEEGVQHGFIVSNENIGTAKWSLCDDVPNGADGIVLGTGKQNTLDILADCPNAADLAANLCDNYTVTEGGKTYDDWYLPSQDELKKLYNNNDIVGPLSKGPYWTSTEASIGGAITISFEDGTESSTTKTFNCLVRAFRSF